MRTITLLAVLAVAGALPVAVSARTVPLGRSWRGRPISAVEVGNRAGVRVLVVGSIHGTETGGIAIARALEPLAPRDLDLCA